VPRGDEAHPSVRHPPHRRRSLWERACPAACRRERDSDRALRSMNVGREDRIPHRAVDRYGRRMQMMPPALQFSLPIPPGRRGFPVERGLLRAHRNFRRHAWLLLTLRRLAAVCASFVEGASTRWRSSRPATLYCARESLRWGLGYLSEAQDSSR